MMLTIEELVNQSESEFLDFKQEYHRNNLKLVYDVLCLLNSDSASDRYIVFGVADDKSIIDISEDIKRKNAAGIIDLLRAKKINRLPLLEVLSTQVDNKTIDVLLIKNTRYKPYFLTEDCEEQGFKIAGGKIVTRIGDANTPVNKSAEDHSIEKMYLERFGLNLSPLEKVKMYLKDIDNWIKGRNEKGELFFYYKNFPEYTFSKDNNSREDFKVEEWVYAFPDSDASSSYFYLKYHSTILDTFTVISCDGGKYVTLLPQMKVEYEGTSYYRIVYFVKDTDKYLLNKMIQKIYLNQSSHYLSGWILEFEDDAHKEEYLSNRHNFFQGPSFYKSGEDFKRYKVLNGERILMLSL